VKNILQADHPNGPPPRYVSSPLEDSAPGINLEDAMIALFGKGLKRPMHCYHGTQMKMVFRTEAVNRLLNHPQMQALRSNLDATGKEILQDYQDYFLAVSTLRWQMNTVRWQQTRVEQGIEEVTHTLNKLCSDEGSVPSTLHTRACIAASFSVLQD
jgi:hypothetical protein